MMVRRIISSTFLVALAALGMFLTAPTALAAPGDPVWCLCSDDVNTINADNVDTQPDKVTIGACTQVTTACVDGSDPKHAHCKAYANETACKDGITIWQANKDAQIRGAQQKGLDANKSAFIPDCALDNSSPVGTECGDVGIFIMLAINIVAWLLGFVGALALVVFMYGGVLMIISAGNAERVEQGKSAMIAAFIGLVIVFSGYALIQFLGKVVGLSTPFLHN